MKIALLGDIAFFGKYSLSENPDAVFKYFEDAARVLQSFDLVVGNLETPLFSGDKPFGYKSAHIKADPINIELLKYLNISIVNLANNHIFDHGVEGYKSTIELLNKNGIEYFGVNNRQLRRNFHGNNVAFSGYCCYSTNACGYYEPGSEVGVNVLNGFQVEKDLHENHKNGFLNIASFHCGQEHVNYPDYDHVLLARKLATKVPYIYYGHHPHVLQGMEICNGATLAYSLGNFCFDDVYTSKSKHPLIQQSNNNKKSAIMVLHVEDSKLGSCQLTPIVAGKDKIVVGNNSEILEEIKKYSFMLNAEESSYRVFRNELIERYLADRRKKRDFNWYVKRLNYRSVGIILTAKINKRKYKECLLNYIR